MIVNYQLWNYVMLLCNAEAGLAKSTNKDCKGGIREYQCSAGLNPGIDYILFNFVIFIYLIVN